MPTEMDRVRGPDRMQVDGAPPPDCRQSMLRRSWSGCAGHRRGAPLHVPVTDRRQCMSFPHSSLPIRLLRRTLCSNAYNSVT